jgi:hypothetical protein
VNAEMKGVFLAFHSVAVESRHLAKKERPSERRNFGLPFNALERQTFRQKEKIPFLLSFHPS